MDGTTVKIGEVMPFSGLEPTKEQALKPLEEAAEAFAAWQAWYGHSVLNGSDSVFTGALRTMLVDECADVIQATCNLLAAIGVHDVTEAMARCERRNRERGRYDAA